MKERFKIAIEEANLTVQQVAESIGLKTDTLRKAINRNSMNDGYLILIQQNCGISKKWLKDGVKPIIVNNINSIEKLFSSDLLNALENVDKDMLVAYMVLRQDQFMKLPSFISFIEKVKVSERISKIVDGD